MVFNASFYYKQFIDEIKNNFHLFVSHSNNQMSDSLGHTILVEKSPLKSFSNINSLFPSLFAHNSKGDTWLREILLPFLNKIYKAFVLMSTTQWYSQIVSCRGAWYCNLFSTCLGLGHCCCDITNCYAILDCTTSGISWDIKDGVQHHRLMEALNDTDIDPIAKGLLGDGYSCIRQNKAICLRIPTNQGPIP